MVHWEMTIENYMQDIMFFHIFEILHMLAIFIVYARFDANFTEEMVIGESERAMRDFASERYMLKSRTLRKLTANL